MKKLLGKLSSRAIEIADNVKDKAGSVEIDMAYAEKCKEVVLESFDKASENIVQVKAIAAEEFKSISAKLNTKEVQQDSGELSDVEPSNEANDIKQSIEKLKGKDKVGVVGEGLAALGGAAVGSAAASSIAAAAGATTLWGSSTLAGLLGGVFVTTTPVGWVIGSAAVASIAGISIAKMIRSGSAQDFVRKELIEKLNQKLSSLGEEKKTESDILLELNQVMTVCIAAELIDDRKANKIVTLIENDQMKPEVALTRLKAMAISAGVIEEVNEKS